jgi:hypothetical protein
MQQIINIWRSFKNENKEIIKEVHWFDTSLLPDDKRNNLLNNLNKQAADLVRQFDILDFSFENQKVYKPEITGITNHTMKFFAPLDNNKEQFFDFTNGEIGAMREPNSEEKAQRGKSIPILPNNWYVAHIERYGKKIVKEQEEQDRDLSIVKTLAVFDFDETLFRSDNAAKRLESDHPLSPDSLPDVAKKSDWNIDIVIKAKELCSNPAVYCVMMTGRVGDRFKDKIDKLLQDNNLFFAETHYNEFGGDTAQYKIDTIKSIIDKLPNVNKLIMWDDDEKKAEKYAEEFNDIIKIKIHLVDYKNS